MTPGFMGYLSPIPHESPDKAPLGAFSPAPATCHSLVGSVPAMSATTATRATCTACGSVDENDDTPLGYCSPECYYREKGAAILNRLESDASHCSTCFRTTVSPRVDVGDLHQSCRDAYAGRTAGPVCPACADRYAWFERRRPLYGENTAVDAVAAEPTDQPHRPVYRPGQGCRCGTTDTGETHRFLQTEGRVVEARRDALFRALVRLADKGAIDGYPDPEAFHAAYAERPTDWRYLAGVAVYGGEHG